MTQKVLIVDDDQLVRNALRRCLRGDTYEVEAAENSSDAFQKLSSERYAVVVSDLKMPRIDGMALLKWVAQNQPSVRRILLTGHADLDAVLEAVNEAGVHRIIQKPWNDSELRVIVEAAVEERGAEHHAAG